LPATSLTSFFRSSWSLGTSVEACPRTTWTGVSTLSTIQNQRSKDPMIQHDSILFNMTINELSQSPKFNQCQAKILAPGT
jgi:hypothetical protein